MNPYTDAQTITDEQLMEKYKKGEYMAFEALYHRHKATVFSYLGKRLKDEESRNEVFQNIFLKFHRTKDNYDSKHLFIKWLYTISRSELFDYCKKKKLATRPLNEEKDLPSETISEDEREIDLDNIKSLTKKEKEAVKLRYYSEQDYNSISQELAVSQSNARKLVSRGISKIKSKLLGGQNG